MTISEAKTTKDFYKEYIKEEPKYKLGYYEWKNILHTYLKYMLLHLLTGVIYRHHHNVGEFQLVKYKTAKPKPNFDKIIKEIAEKYDLSYQEARQKLKEVEYNKYTHTNRKTDGWKFVLAWYRKEYKFPFSSLWKIKISRRKAWKLLLENMTPTTINQLTESKYYGVRKYQ